MSAVREFQVTFDAHDPDRLARFWAEALGYRLEPPPAPFADWDQALEAWGVPPEPRGTRSRRSSRRRGSPVPGSSSSRSPSPRRPRTGCTSTCAPPRGWTGEAALEALETECDRLVGLGARPRAALRARAEPGSDGYLVMTDPEGNEFCLD